MRVIVALCLLMTVAGAAAAFELGNRAPAKPAESSVYVEPEEVRQGGNTIAQAVAISIPGTYAGTTTGYADYYDECCPYTGSVSPDVVYSVTPDITAGWDLDLCFSSYDTKIYIYDTSMNLIACNDDFHFSPPCFVYSSKLLNTPLQGGVTYYIIIDGHAGHHGNYRLDITEHVPCVLSSPASAQLENEPPLEVGYLDAHNGGCNSPEFDTPFQEITGSVFCGVAGWYFAGNPLWPHRDTDWFHILIPDGGVLEITGDAEFATYLFELWPHDCQTVAVAQHVIIGQCAEATMTITGEPGSLVWFWVGSTVGWAPEYFDGDAYNYVLHLNLEELVKTERQSWTSVKSLFQ